MTAIFGDVRLDRRQFRDLVMSRIAHVIARMQGVLAVTTRVGHEIDDRIHTLGGHQRSRVPRMSWLTARFASTLRPATPFALSAGEAVGRRRFRGCGRVLLPQRELSFEIRDPFLLFSVLSPQSFVFSLQALNLFVLTSRLVDADTRTIRFLRRPGSTRHARYGTPLASICTAPELLRLTCSWHVRWRTRTTSGEIPARSGRSRGSHVPATRTQS